MEKNKYNIQIDTNKYTPPNLGHSIYKYMSGYRSTYNRYYRYYYDYNTGFKLYGFEIRKYIFVFK
jgi:hypothetical protein